MAESLELLQELCDALGVSGYEDDVRGLVEKRVRPLVDEVRTDALGSLIAVKRSARPDAPTLLLDAHLDEIGLVISYIEPNGFLRFATVGGWDERVLPAHAVDVRTRDGQRHRGVLGIPPPHIQKNEEKGKPYSAESMFIDIGARSRDEVLELGIRVGDSAAPSYPLTRLAGDTVMGKALDNRAGIAVLLRTLENLSGAGAPAPDGLDVTIAAVFPTFEEVGARGAAAAAFGINPQLALVLESTVAGDFPGVPAARNPSCQGGGPVITLMDRSAFCSPRITDLLRKLAQQEAIPHQIKTPIFGGTDASTIHTTRAGIPTGIVSIPCRYIHSPHATLRLQDFENTVRLVTSFVRNCASLAL